MRFPLNILITLKADGDACDGLVVIIIASTHQPAPGNRRLCKGMLIHVALEKTLLLKMNAASLCFIVLN